MVSEDLLDAGLILVFNNGLEDRYAYRTSAVQAIDPVAAEVVWEHRSENFFSSVGGTVQPLPKNTILITSSQGGRVFEIMPDGRFVWEWAPPFKPMRVARIPYDHCPQLVALERTPETRVRPENRKPYIDHDLYRFEFLPQTEERVIEGKEKAPAALSRCVSGAADAGRAVASRSSSGSTKIASMAVICTRASSSRSRLTGSHQKL